MFLEIHVQTHFFTQRKYALDYIYVILYSPWYVTALHFTCVTIFNGAVLSWFKSLGTLNLLPLNIMRGYIEQSYLVHQRDLTRYNTLIFMQYN